MHSKGDCGKDRHITFKDLNRFFFPRENYASAEIVEQGAGIFAHQFNGF
jgi:hypothetical protein